MNLKKILKNGNVFYSVADTARILKTTKANVHVLMGKNLVEWDQTRLNGPLIIEAKSILRYQHFVDSSKQA